MRLLLISSSLVHGFGYLDSAEPHIRKFLEGRRRVAFIPFAGFDRDAYTAKVRDRFGRMGFAIAQVREVEDLEGADAIFIGGGNTFRLLKTLYERALIDAIRERVRDGVPYVGSSAGTVICGPTIRTTNDMPIVQPPSFDSLAFVPYQINPHYLDPDPSSTHKGETREERLREFHEENATPVVGLREGTQLLVEDGRTTLVGERHARIFRRGEQPVEVPPGPLDEAIGPFVPDPA